MADSGGAQQPTDRLADARGRFASDWRELRESVRLETGQRPRLRGRLLWPILALTAGLAVGAGLWRRRGR